MIVLRNKEPELEQREFGFYTSKIKRPIKAKIGNVRANLYKKISDSANNNLNKMDDLMDQVQHYQNTNLRFKPENKNIDFYLKNEVEKANSNFQVEPGSSYFMAGKSKKDKNNVVVDPNSKNLVSLAHEIGHAKNHEGLNGKLQQKITNECNKTYEKTKDNSKPKRLKLGQLNSIKGHILENLEEINASRSGIRMLKKSGVSKKELKLAKKQLKDSYKTYLNKSLADQKLKLAKKLEFRGGNSVRHHSAEMDDLGTILNYKDSW